MKMRTRIKKVLLLTGVLLVSAANLFAGSNDKGIELFRTGLFEAAKINFMQQTNLSGTEQAENYFYLGQVYFMLNQVDSARYFYQKAVDTDPEYPFGYVGLGKLELKNNPKAAEDLFKKALGLAKKDASVATAIAEIYIAAGDRTKADEFLEKARKMNAKYPGIFIVMGDMFKADGKIGDASSQYENALLYDPNNKIALLRLAQIYRGINADQALQYLNKLVAIDPNFIPAFAEIGDINYAKGRYKAAVDAYEKLVSIPGIPLAFHERFASALYFAEQYDKSLEVIKYVLAKDPNNLVMYRIEAYNNFRNKNFSLGLEQMTKFIQNTPAEKHIYFDFVTLGDLQMEMKQPELAIESFKRALELDSTKILVYDKLIAAAEAAKNFPLAIEFYERSFAANPDFSLMSLFYYGQANFNAAAHYITPDVIAAETTPTIAAANEASFNTFIDKGFQAFSDVITRKPDTYLGYLWRANIKALVDNFNQLRNRPVTGVAKPYYEEALNFMLANNADGKRNADIIQCYRYLASYYYSINDLNTVADFYKKILALDPNDGQAQNALDMINKVSKK